MLQGEKACTVTCHHKRGQKAVLVSCSLQPVWVAMFGGCWLLLLSVVCLDWVHWTYAKCHTFDMVFFEKVPMRCLSRTCDLLLGHTPNTLRPYSLNP